MAKVQTYVSQVLPTEMSGGALANPSMVRTGQEQIANAFGNIGELAAKLAQKQMVFNDSIADVKAVQIMKNAELEYQSKIEQDGDTNNYPKYWQESIMKAQSQLGQLNYGTSHGQEKGKVESTYWSETFANSARVSMIKQQARDTVLATEATWEVSMMSGDAQKSAMAKDAYVKALSETMPPELVKMTVEQKEATFMSEFMYNQVRDVAFNAPDTKTALEIINNSDLSSEQKLQLEPSISAHFERMSAKAKESSYQKKIQTQLDFAQKLQTHDLTEDEIYEYSADKDVRDTWSAYRKVADTEPEPKLKNDGFNATSQVIMDLSAGTLSKEQAINKILDARYKDKSINNAQFNWSLDKIQNMYPKHLAAEIKTVIQDNIASYNYDTRFGGQQENQLVNQQLIELVDDKLKKGQEVTGGDLYGWSARIRQSYINAQNPIFNYTINMQNPIVQVNERIAEGRSMFDVQREEIPDPSVVPSNDIMTIERDKTGWEITLDTLGLPDLGQKRGTTRVSKKVLENLPNLNKKLTGTAKFPKEDTDKTGLKALENARKIGMGY